MFDIFSKYDRYKKYKRTVNELRNMTDRDLCDIGISRADIKAIARDHCKR